MLGFQLSTSDEIIREIGQRLRAQRMVKSMTQEELAARAGVGIGAVKKLEAGGNATLQTLVRVIQALSLTEDLEGIFRLQTTRSIAEMEREALSQRKRARRPRVS